MAIGIVLANPDKNNDQPRVLRDPRSNLSASSKPAPNPIAPRVAAMSAICGIVTDFFSEKFIITPINPLFIQVRVKPLSREPRHSLECARFFKQMRCAGYDLQLLLAFQLFKCELIHLDDWIVETTDDQ